MAARPHCLPQDALPRTPVQCTPASRTGRVRVGGPGAPSARPGTHCVQSPRPSPAARPPGLQVRAACRAHRVLLLHHLVHFLCNADYLVFHGSDRSSPRPALLGQEWAKLGKKRQLDASSSARRAQHSRPDLVSSSQTKPAAAAAAPPPQAAPIELRGRCADTTKRKQIAGKRQA